MLEIKGKYATARVYASIIDEKAIQQIQEICDQKLSEGCSIAIMSDVHSGKGCVIGFTADFKDKVIPNIVGVDIGCGMLTVKLKTRDFSLEKLDQIIHQYIPSGKAVHQERMIHFDELKDLYCYRDLKDTKRLERSIGTLGGGNHFIEIDQDDDQNQYLIIHSGSRNLGKQVADHYQKLAVSLMAGKDELLKQQQAIIDEYKKAGRKQEIQQALQQLHQNFKAKEISLPHHLCYLTGEYREKYLHDMAICQKYASLNRKSMADIILQHMFDQNLEDHEYFETIHNYIDLEHNIIRKGAVSARKDEILLIPINMRDGSLICKGKGNKDWNHSAPHGAGRIMSRTQAKSAIALQDFQKAMEGIYSTSVNMKTLDESPFAYKSMEEITKHITSTVDIIKIIKPIYNYKAGD